MNHTLHFSRRRRLLAVLTVVCSLALPAGAQGIDCFYAINAHIEAFPAGAGKLYATTNIKEALTGKSEADVPTWYDEMNLRFVADSNWKSIGAWAKPADGWQYAGFQLNQTTGFGPDCKVVFDEEQGYVVYGYHWESNSPIIPLTSEVTYYDNVGNPLSKDERDSAEVAKLIPDAPTDYVRLLFTHVRAKVADGHSGMGRAAILESQVVNYIGDHVMMRAQPNDATSKFEGWFLDGELVSKDLTLIVEVTGVATYEARFSNPLAKTVFFPVGGGYIEWYSDYDYSLNEDVYCYQPKLNSAGLFDIQLTSKRQTYLIMLRNSTIVEGKRAALLHGSGEMTLYPNSTVPAASPYEDMLFKWSGEEGVKLVSGKNYYLLNPSGELFELVEDATIPANRLYIDLPNDLLNNMLGAPKKIYIDQQAYTSGIDGITVDQPRSRSGIYTIDGRRVEQMDRDGIYVTDGKKIYYRQR